MIPLVIFYVMVYIIIGTLFLLFDVLVLNTPIQLNPISLPFYIILWPMVALMRLKDAFF